jgi:hypothetical protein
MVKFLRLPKKKIQRFSITILLALGARDGLGKRCLSNLPGPQKGYSRLKGQVIVNGLLELS